MDNRMRGLLGRLALVVVAASLLTLDQFSKNWVVSTYQPGDVATLAPWIDPFLNVIYVTNTGTAFGLFQGASNLFTIVAIVVIVAILVYVRRLTGREFVMHLVLGVMLGGALGNLVDRFRFTHVVDFLHFNFWPLQGFPIFNVADFSIVSGVILLALLSLIEDRRLARAEAVRAQAAGEASPDLPAPAPLDKDG